MADENASFPDSAALLQRALQQSWQRDRRIRRWRLPWRWCVWWLTRYGSSFIAAALVSASTPPASNALPTPAAEALKLTPSYQLKSPTPSP
jgi:hypothetical protein